MINTAITTPSRPNAMRNGTSRMVSLIASRRTSSQDTAPVSAPAGTVASTAVFPVPTSSVEPAAEKR